MSKSNLLRQQLKRRKPIVLVAAHNALSAKLAQQAGFDGIWASSFEISASHAMPDANILTMFENLNITKSINDKIKIPVIADCDNGYGNAINVMRTVEEYEKVGIAGICIEDNIFPKRCSFYSGVKRELESIEEFAGKIKAAKGTQKSKDFVVIARTEALIAGYGQQEALRRAIAYEKAGADLIMPHSKTETADQVLQFAKKWYRDHQTPLVAVPTIYKNASVKELHRAGFKIIIFANHGIRASIKAIRKVFKALKEGEKAAAADRYIVPLTDVYKLIGVEEMKGGEVKYLPKGEKPPKTIILAGGAPSPTIKEIAGDLPVSMMDVRGRPLLQRQLDTLSKFNITDVTVIRGYKKDKMEVGGVKFIDDDHFRKYGILHAFFLAKKELEGKVLFSYGDLLYDDVILEKLLASKKDITLVIDAAWIEDKTFSHNPDLVVTKNGTVKSHRFYPLEKTDRVLKLGKKIDYQKANGEFIGLALFSAKGTKILKKVYQQAKKKYSGKPFHEAESFAKGHFNGIIQKIIDSGYPVHALKTYKGWLDVDSFEDYRKAWTKIG